jgi:hypothetical protein
MPHSLSDSLKTTGDIGLVGQSFQAAEWLSAIPGDFVARPPGFDYVPGEPFHSTLYDSVATGSETAASDIDVMVVGEGISMDDVVSALSEAQRDLAREVNPSAYRTGEFCRKLAGGHHFVSSVVSGPKIFLIGDENELARLAQIRMAQGAQAEPAGNRRPVRRRR